MKIFSCLEIFCLRLARRFQSPATQTKPGSEDDIPEVTQEDQTVANPTEAVPEVVPPKRRSTRTSRGTKRKLEDELEQVGDIRLLPKKVKF